MKATFSGGFSWIGTGQTSGTVLQQIASHDKFMFDLTIPTGFSGNWFNTLLAFNGATGGWRQGAASITLPLTAGTQTITVDYSALTKPLASDSWFQIFLGFNGPAGAPRDFYVDNFRTAPVPEPATIAVLAVGALALLRRRR